MTARGFGDVNLLHDFSTVDLGGGGVSKNVWVPILDIYFSF